MEAWQGGEKPGMVCREENDRIVIFTERIDILKFLRNHLPADLKHKTNQVEILHGGLGDMEQQ